MLAREVGTDELRADMGRSAVDLDAVPVAGPGRIGEEALQGFSIEIALAAEVPVEAPMRQSDFGHDPADRDAIEPEPIEQPASGADDRLACRVAAGGRVGHEASVMRCSASGIEGIMDA